MITITRALQLVYNYSEQDALDFLEKHHLENNHENPFLEIENRIERTCKAYYPFDWVFCTSCKNYRVEHVDSLKFGSVYCRCGGKML